VYSFSLPASHPFSQAGENQQIADGGNDLIGKRQPLAPLLKLFLGDAGFCSTQLALPTGRRSRKRDGGPEDLSNVVNERVNYDEITGVDLASAPQGFHISVLTDRIQVKFFVHEDWRAQDAVDSLEAKLISSIDTEDLGAVWIKYREQPTSL
jgi:hypothetical protein